MPTKKERHYCYKCRRRMLRENLTVAWVSTYGHKVYYICNLCYERSRSKIKVSNQISEQLENKSVQ